jgi:flavin reductase (DIM6/NTAB) family NADH-FMN oxidoreductase RutF
MPDSKTLAAGLDPISDPLALRAAFGCFPSGVIAVCALEGDGRPVGMAASAFVSLSLDPPLVAISLQRTSTSWPRLRKSERLGLSVLGQDQEHACERLSGKGDRFGAIEWMPTGTGAVMIGGASAWLECQLFDEVSAGDGVPRRPVPQTRGRRACRSAGTPGPTVPMMGVGANRFDEGLDHDSAVNT